MVEAAGLASRRLGARCWRGHPLGPDGAGVSKLRNGTPTLALSDDPEVARAMALFWGVTPRSFPTTSTAAQVLAVALEWSRARDLIHRGKHVVLVRGTMPNNPTHNALLVQEVK